MKEMVSTDRMTFEAAFARTWADRHCDRVVVFANGHVYDQAARRETLRVQVDGMRRAKVREAAGLCKMVERGG